MKQNKTMMRVFSLLLCLCMVLVYIPVSAFAVTMTGGEVLYLKPNSNWTEANARFAAYFFGNGNPEWASMTPVAGETNLYEVTVPAGSWTGVIFCRMNPSAAANNWDNRWNQTADLSYDGTNNCYTVKDGTWDGGGGTWSAYPPAECTHPEFADGACTTCGELLRTATVADLENGTVTVNPAQGVAGTIVTVTAVANEDYKLESLSAVCGETDVTITDNQFVMPEGDVTVSATFVAIADEDYITVYFQNNMEWTDINVYYWNDEGNNTWPGELMTLKGKDHTFSANGENVYDVYSFHIPVDATNFLINGKMDGNSVQTLDLTVGTEDGICYCIQGEGSEGKYPAGTVAKPGAATYEINVVAEKCTVTAPKTAAEGGTVNLKVTPNEGCLLESLTVMSSEGAVEVIDGQFTMPAGDVTVTAISREITEDDYATVYFQNNWVWTDVNIYYWGSEIGENPAWPGYAMTNLGTEHTYSNGAYEVYSYKLPADIDGFIINGVKDDGSGDRDQTPNIEEGLFDGICYFMTWNDGNQAGAMISPEVAPETPVEEWSISLGDNIGVNFKVHAAIADHLDFSVNGTSLTKQVTANGDGTATVSVGLAAAQMADIITIKGCGMAYEKTYCVKTYAEEILAGEYSDETKALVTEMLNYGAAAQMHFQYNTENLVKEDYAKDQALTLEAAAVEVADSVNGLGYYGASLLFRNKIAVRFYFTGSVEGCTFTVGDNTYTPVLKDGRYYVEVADIAPDALDQQITLKVTDVNGAEISVTYGPMNYIKRMYEKEDTSESLKDVLENLYHYHKAAVAYVTSLSTEA